MEQRTRSRRRRTSSRLGDAGAPPPGGLALLITLLLLAGIVLTGPCILGAARLWIELPLLTAVGALGFIQGLRLALAEPLTGERRIDAIDWTVGLFVLYGIGRWLTSPTEYFSRVEAMDIVAYGTIFYTCRYGLANRKLGMVLIYALVVLGLGETAFGWYLSNHLDWFPFGPDERLQLHYAPRWLGTYGCPNHYGYLLVMAIGAALAIGSFSKLPWPLRIVMFYLAIMMTVGVIQSASRGSWIALIAALIALVIFAIRHGTMRWYVPVGGSIVLVIVGVVLFSLSPVAKDRYKELEELLTGHNFYTYVRVELARDALRIAHDHPAFGTGPGTFVFVHPRYQDETFAYKAVLTHDDYLNCLDDYGLVGFSLAILFVWLVTLKFFQQLHADNRWQDRVIIATGFSAWLALVFHSFVDFNLHIPANALFFFALVGLALGRFRTPEETRHWSLFSLAPLGRGLGLCLVVISALLAYEAGRSAWSDIIYEQAFARADVVPNSESIEAMKQALSIDPGNAQASKLMGDFYRYKESRQKTIEGRMDDGQLALNAYQRALAANPLDDTIQASMGMTFDVMHRFPEAYFCYATAVTNQPYEGQFWYRLGNHYWARNFWVKAEEAYRMALSCPRGGGDAVAALQELRGLPELDGVPVPPKGTNPLTSPNVEEEQGTLP